MKQRRIISAVAAVMTVLLLLVTATSCQKVSYGSTFATQDELERALSDASLNFKYPGYLGEDGDAGEYQYIGVKDMENGQFSGYKIYHFGSPFYISVTAFLGESDALMSDEESRTQFLTEEQSARGPIRMYSGKGHEDALYLIGCINIDGNHYEIRITNDEQMDTGNKYLHAIYADNEYYSAALKAMVRVAESIQS